MTTQPFKFLNRFLCTAPFAALLVASMPVLAEPPSRIGRISLLQGEVSWLAEREEGWTRAQLNYPVSSNNSLATDSGSRAEVRIGATAVRINEQSTLDFVLVQDEQTLLFLQRGTLNVRLRADGGSDRADPRIIDGGFRVETAAGEFTLSAIGRYRIDTFPESAETRVSVFAGRLRFDNRDNRIILDAGQSLIVSAAGGAAEWRFEPAVDTSFDRWAEARDQGWDQTHSRYVQERAVSANMTGYEDLDEHGDWAEDREYGRLWMPRTVADDWAPYRYGRWAHVQPWGWTWIDDAAWGFAPFHYGRWVQVRARWAWWPGPYVRRPVYAPALVAWFNRPGVNWTLSSGDAVGWFPLAPREVYLPHYSSNVTYIRNINYVTNINVVIKPPTRYLNQLPGATVVDHGQFHSGRRIGRDITRVPPALIAAQTPGSGLEFGPRLQRPARYNGPADGRNDDRRTRPTFTPINPAPPTSPNNIPRPRPSPPVMPAPESVKPIPLPHSSGPLPLSSFPPAVSSPRFKPTPEQSQPMPQPLPLPNASIESRAAPIPVPAPAPAFREPSRPSPVIEDYSRGNRSKPREVMPATERPPMPPAMPPASPNVNNLNSRSMGDRVAPTPRPPAQTVVEPRPEQKPAGKPESDGKPVPKGKPKPEASEKELKADVQKGPKEVER